MSTKTLSIYENLLMRFITAGRLAGFVCFSFVCCPIPTLNLTQTLALTLTVTLPLTLTLLSSLTLTETPTSTNTLILTQTLRQVLVYVR